jgi:hypothetical protein
MPETENSKKPLSHFLGEGGARAKRGRVRVASRHSYRPNSPAGRTTRVTSKAPNATAGAQDGP